MKKMFKTTEINQSLPLISALIIAFIIAVVFIEGKVYQHGTLSYAKAAVLEISLFAIGFIAGRSSKNGRRTKERTYNRYTTPRL